MMLYLAHEIIILLITLSRIIVKQVLKPNFKAFQAFQFIKTAHSKDSHRYKFSLVEFFLLIKVQV